MLNGKNLDIKSIPQKLFWPNLVNSSNYGVKKFQWDYQTNFKPPCPRLCHIQTVKFLITCLIKTIFSINTVCFQTIFFFIKNKLPFQTCVCIWKNGKETVECINRDLGEIPDGVEPSTQVPIKYFLTTSMIVNIFMLGSRSTWE